jgi:4-azaleucine resistance transporter AzlC
MSRATEDFVAGARTAAPFLLGVAPFGLVVGVTALEVGFTAVQAVAMSVALFTGAAQLAMIELVGRGAPLSVVVVTAVVVNLRYLMYSASLAPYFRRFSVPIKWLGGYAMTDHSYALAVVEFRETTPDERSRAWYYFGAAAPVWVVWIATTVVGVAVGASIEGLSLAFAVPLMFMALLFPAIEDRPTAIAGAVAGVAAAVGTVLPLNVGLVTAAGFGIAAGVGVELRRGTFPTDEREESRPAGNDDASRIGAGDDRAGGEDP